MKAKKRNQALARLQRALTMNPSAILEDVQSESSSDGP